MCVLLNAKPEKPDPRFDFAFEMLKTISSRLVRTRNMAAMMYDPVDGQCNFSQRLPVLVSRITDEPETPVSDILAVAVGQTIPPALCHSFAYLNYGRSDVLSFACTLMQGGLSPKSLVEQGYDEVQVRLLDPVDLKEEAINSRGTYEEVFRNALHSNMLCLGLYRYIHREDRVWPSKLSKMIVVTEAVIASPENNIQQGLGLNVALAKLRSTTNHHRPSENLKNHGAPVLRHYHTCKDV
ncbi:uncharacterized protein LOC119587182 [Penaeus monodon]|uniref:uncharacterized protein LOC119587182 n=1 Tax=Penaeus monodon TaxID=6687 RepID=UPI0018A7723A|nr:uncharacterized protein LOC119587182 [Penaeus monodon]